MSGRRLRIWKLAETAVSDMVRAVRAAPGLFVFLLGLAVAGAYLEQAAPDALGLPAAVAFVLELAVYAVVTAAVAVTLHRFVILSETNTVASLAARWRIVFDFASVVFGAWFLIVLPALLALSIWPQEGTMPVWVSAVCGAIIIAGFLALLRYLLVFPAIAIGAEDCGLRAGAASVGRVILPIVLAYILAMLMISIVGLIVYFLALLPIRVFGAVIDKPWLLALDDEPHVWAFYRLVVGVAMSAAAVAIVSRAYLWREGRWPSDQT